MKFKTLLLGSAAALVVAGGAQAADLSIAEPVDYVRICDAFGTGYWYIPGTDTCLKIGGKVQFDARFFDLADVYYGVGTSASTTFDHSAQWSFITEVGLNFTAKSMTEYGVLTGYIALVAKSDNSSYDGGGGVSGYKLVKLDNAYLEFGNVLMGWTGSLYDYGGGYTYDGSIHSDTKTDQVRFTWAAAGFGFALSVEDPRDRWGTSLGTTYSMPDIIAALTMSQGSWDAKLSAGFTEGGGYIGSGLSGWGIQGAVTVKLDSIAPGDELRLKAAFANNAGSFVGGPLISGSNWSALASIKHYFTPMVAGALTFAYLNNGATTAAPAANYNVAGNLVWYPAAGASFGAQVLYANVGGTGAVSVRLQGKREW
jgi:hypothetical protein